MAADSSSDRPAAEQVVVDVQDSRELGPVEAEELLRECLSLTHKRLDAAILRVFERLQGAAPEEQEPPLAPAPAPTPGKPEATIASALQGKRPLFTARFRKAFDEALQRRREGKTRPRIQRGGAVTLAIVEHEAHSAQVTLKTAVQAMREATQDEAFALDFRVRMLLRERLPPGGAFDNPWSHEYICDALGSVSRELWPKDDLWRAIMESLVVGLTPHVAALHRELNVLLQDRDVLPALRVRTHARKGAQAVPHAGSRALFGELVKLLGGQAPPGGKAPGGRSALPGETGASVRGFLTTTPRSIWPRSGTTRPGRGAPGAAGEWMVQQNALLWSAIVNALGNLQRGAPIPAGLPELAGIDRQALRAGTASELRAVQRAFEGKGGSPVERAAIDAVAGVLDYVFNDPYLCEPIKSAFGQMQIPLMRAALLDPGMVTDRQHPARRFFDTLALAAVDLDPETERGRALVELASRLAQMIRNDFGNDLRVFDVATGELAAFLDAERAQFNARLAEAVPPLVAEDERADARAEAETALEARLAGRAVPPEIRAFLDHECVARLAAICLKDGPEGPAWDAELEMVEDLLWSITPKTTAAARKKLAGSLPALLARIDRDWPPDDDAQARRQSLRGCLFDLHLRSIKTAAEPTGAQPQPALAIANATPTPPRPEPDEYDEQVVALVRGDWVEFRGEGATVLARLAWRAPQRRRLLFAHRDGRTAFVHTPESLSDAFRHGRAVLAIEAVPLFDRAMARIVGERSRQSAGAAASA